MEVWSLLMRIRLMTHPFEGVPLPAGHHPLLEAPRLFLESLGALRLLHDSKISISEGSHIAGT